MHRVLTNKFGCRLLREIIPFLASLCIREITFLITLSNDNFYLYHWAAFSIVALSLSRPHADTASATQTPTSLPPLLLLPVVVAVATVTTPNHLRSTTNLSILPPSTIKFHRRRPPCRSSRTPLPSLPPLPTVGPTLPQQRTASVVVPSVARLVAFTTTKPFFAAAKPSFAASASSISSSLYCSRASVAIATTDRSNRSSHCLPYILLYCYSFLPQ
ncbi:hypothetical protein B296_00012219 [Ensete ventricosum]|uniref:Uncharacterized protein n=1 Tax=Ensete ventricosum TaxID=4639 RepID=A0A426Z5K2_ENSVE|nr:hypothetical protein B296_00012219 [Ensete ventricosum]